MGGDKRDGLSHGGVCQFTPLKDWRAKEGWWREFFTGRVKGGGVIEQQRRERE